MEDEDIAPNTYSLSSRYRQKVAPVGKLHYISVHTDCISCMYLAQFPSLSFRVVLLIYIQLLHL